MLRTLLAVILALAVSAAGAQIVNRPVAAGAISNPGTSLPATCAVGYVYFKSNSTAGQNLHLCTAANTWTQMTGGNLANPVTPAQGGSGVANSKNLTWSASLTFAGTDATTMTFPTTSATIARTDAANAFTGVQEINAVNAAFSSTNGGWLQIESGFAKTDTAERQGMQFRSNEAFASNPVDLRIAQYGNATASKQGWGLYVGHIGADFNAVLCLQCNGTGRVVIGALPSTDDGTNSVQVAGAIKVANYYSTAAPNTQTGASYTVAVTDSYIIANVAGTQTLTLPAAATYPGRRLCVKTITANTVVSASSNVAPLTSATAATAILAATAGKWACMVSDATNWVVMEGN